MISVFTIKLYKKAIEHIYKPNSAEMFSVLTK